MASINCSSTPCGNARPVRVWTIRLNSATTDLQSSADRSGSFCTPFRFLASSITRSKCSLGISRTTLENIAMKRRYASQAKRSLFVSRASASTVLSFRPRLRIVSIIPGIEQRRSVAAEPLPGPALELAHRGIDGRPEILAQPLALGVEAQTLLGHDRKARRDGQAGLRHLGEAGALPAQELFHAPVALVKEI